MFAITGATGQVGGELTRALLAAGHPVRVVVRDAAKGKEWAAKGCDVAVAEMEDSEALERAFSGTKGVFILPPSCFDPEPGFPEALKVIQAVRDALKRAKPSKVVCLSTIGAQSQRINLLTQRTYMEQSLAELPLNITFLRPGWFMENTAWDIPAAQESGVLACYLQPLDKAFPMVATADVGQTAARLLQEDWQGLRVVELEGPERVSPRQLAKVLGEVLGREVRPEVVPRDQWESIFRSQGMQRPVPRIQMVDGFNEGWIAFETPSPVKGKVHLRTVIHALASKRS
jgi:uncharacterized protein YbjT (DUF2867 family)